MLSTRSKWAYSLGHVLNDVCATIWFSYTLIFFQRVLCFSTRDSGFVILIGQVADGVSTLCIGFIADKNIDWSICRYGKRKLWHLIGTICVVSTFEFIFGRCIGCQQLDESVQMVYYSAFAIVFQFGWAAVQISHLALIPFLSYSQSDRTFLNTSRYSFTVASNVLVYSVAWIVLGSPLNSSRLTEAPVDRNLSTSRNVTTSGIGPRDAIHFRIIVLTTMAVGIVASIIFHLFTSEHRHDVTSRPDHTREVTDCAETMSCRESETGGSCPHPARVPTATRTDSFLGWIRCVHFWVLVVIYMCSRLYVNLTMMYLTLYFHDYLKAGPTSIAIGPFIMYMGSLTGSLCVGQLGHVINRRMWLVFGSLLGVVVSVILYIVPATDITLFCLVPAIFLLGCAGSLVLVTTLALVADILQMSSSTAVIYGSLSLFDKFSNGAVVILIQTLTACSTDCGEFYRIVISIVSGFPSLIICILSVFYGSKKLWRFSMPDTSTDVGESESLLSASNC